MTERINPFTDAGYKRIFGQEPSKDLLISFLNGLLEGERKITDVTFLDKEQLRESDESRTLIYDVFCKTDTGENIIVEMQNRIQPYYKKRSIYYISRAISNQGESGRNWMYGISAVYCISLMNFTDDAISRKFRTDVALMDMETGELFSRDMRLIYLQLPRFRNTLEECCTLFDKWIYVLNHMEVLERLPEALQMDIFKKLTEVTDVASLSKDERAEYDYALKHYRDALCLLDGARLEGLREGRLEGIQEGHLNMAKKLKALGISFDVIQASSGLSLEEIEKL